MKTLTNCSSMWIRFVVGLALFALSVGPVLSQETAARPDRGVVKGASYSVSDIENISLTNGNLSLSIPLASLPPIAGGKLGFTLNATYNSKLWDVSRGENQLPPIGGCASWVTDFPQLSDRGGWNVDGTYRITFHNAEEDFNYVVPDPPPSQGCEQDISEQARLQSNWYRVLLTSPDGTEHELRPTDNSVPYGANGGTRSYLFNYYKDTPDTIQAPMRYYSFDGSFLYAIINPSSYTTRWTIYMKDGTRISQSSDGVQRIYDTNGNSIKIFEDGNGKHYQDEHTGREIKVTYSASANGGQGQTKVWYQTAGGGWQTIDINHGTTTVQGKFYVVNDWNPTGGEMGNGSPCMRDQLLTTTAISVIREIVFPVTQAGVTAQRFIFSYNSDTTSSATDDVNWACGAMPEPYTRTVSNGMGELSQLTTPSGAVINYQYTRDGVHRTLGFDNVARGTIKQKQVVHDSTTDTWTYDIDEAGGCSGGITNPDGSKTRETCYPHDPAFGSFFGHSFGKGGLVYRSNRSDKILVERHWTTMPFSGANSGMSGNNQGAVSFNPIVDAEYTSLLEGNPGQPVRMSAKTFQYDFNGNLTQTTEYDWFDPALVSRDGHGVPTGVPAGASVLRVTNNSYYNEATTASSGNVYAKRALATVTPLILNALQQSTLGSAITQLSYDGQAYGQAPTIGNLTTKRVWNNLSSSWITTSNTYGLYGNVGTATDGRGKVTQFFFDDATHALPNRVIVDPQNGTGTQTTTTAYDYSTGLVTTQTDPNGQPSTIDYTNQLLGTVDPFNRPGVVTSPPVSIGGVNHQRKARSIYEDNLRRVTTESDLNTQGDFLLKSRVTTDQLGRSILSETSENGSTYTINSQTVYQQMGRITFVSNAKRSTAAQTDGWTRSTTDNAGRLVEVATFSTAAMPPATGTNANWTGSVISTYFAEFTTVTDQAGKVRRSMVDGLGRLVRVDEPDANNNLGSTANPVQPTNYNYDGFDNLVKVIQGSQIRYFMYDSLKRLVRARNPEQDTHSNLNLSDPHTGNSQWSTGYQYDENGNLTQKTDARGIVSSYAYDGLNRNTTVNYSNTTINPDITRIYDGATKGVGRLWQTYTGGTETTGATVEHVKINSYDALGRLLDQRQRFKTNSVWSGEYRTQRTYNVSHVTSQTYPSGHTVNFSYDAAGRLSSFTGNLGDGVSRNYATSISYNSSGQWTREQFGTQIPLYNKRHFNSRGQLYDMRLGTVNDAVNYNRGAIINYYSLANYGFGTTGPDTNGNVYVQQHFVPNDDAITGHTFMQQNYDYDSLNRLKWVAEYQNGATETGSQNFAYDRWGNRTISFAYGTGINNKSFTVNTSNNRLVVPSGQSGTMSYDAAGNLTVDTYSGSATARAYDAENRMTSETQAGGVVAGTYTYNADGQRVRRKVNAVETWQVYGMDGELLAEYAANSAAASAQKEYGYRNGELLITAEPASGGGSGAQPVTWTNTVGVAANGNNLTKTAAEGWGNAGAASTQTIASGDGYVEFTATETNTYRMIGLSNGDSHQNYNDIDFAIYPAIGGTLYVYEGGASRGTFGSYATGDTLRVAVEGGVVKYRKNGALLYTSTLTPTYPLLVDTSFYSNGGTISNVMISTGSSGGSTQNASWTNTVGVAANGNNLTKTAAEGWGNAGAASTQTIASGDGYVEFTATETNTYRMIGLSNGDSHQNYNDIDFAIYPAIGGTLYVYEGGASRGTFGSYATGDTLRVAVEGGVVKYRRNGALLYTSTLTPTYPLLVDTSFYSNGGTINNVKIGSGSGGGGSSAQIRWLVTDHLGTPRIIADHTGSLAGIKRHDYLPFGEELLAGPGGRTMAQGYGGDSVRQKFTQKERDIETGLDYFGARYHASTQGRFTSPDPFGPWAMSEDEKAAFMFTPQQWNRYTYCLNNPLKLIDPTGLEVYDSNVDETAQKNIHNALVEISKNGTKQQRIVASFILKNDVLIKLVHGDNSAGISNAAAANERIAKGWTSMSEAASYTQINIDAGIAHPNSPERSANLEGVLVHEGNHVYDDARTMSSLSAAQGMNKVWDPTIFKTENDAYHQEASYLLKRGGTYHTVGLDTNGIVNGYGKGLLKSEKGRIGVNEERIRNILINLPYRVSKESPGPTTTQKRGLRPPG